MPPSRNASGVEPPAVPATPPVLSCIAIAGDSTEMLIATASTVRNVPRAKPCPPGPVSATRPVSIPWLIAKVSLHGGVVELTALVSAWSHVLAHATCDVDACAGDVAGAVAGE